MKTKETIYSGERWARTVRVNGRVLDPLPSQKIYNHSPDGFNWGYGGSGPAQLALAILLDYFGPESDQLPPVFLHSYQDFKFAVIAGLPQDDDWTLTGEQIESAMAKIIGRHFLAEGAAR